MSRARRKKAEFGDVAGNIYRAGVDVELAAAGGGGCARGLPTPTEIDTASAGRSAKFTASSGRLTRRQSGRRPTAGYSGASVATRETPAAGHREAAGLTGNSYGQGM